MTKTLFLTGLMTALLAGCGSPTPPPAEPATAAAREPTPEPTPEPAPAASDDDDSGAPVGDDDDSAAAAPPDGPAEGAPTEEAPAEEAPADEAVAEAAPADDPPAAGSGSTEDARGAPEDAAAGPAFEIDPATERVDAGSGTLTVLLRADASVLNDFKWTVNAGPAKVSASKLTTGKEDFTLTWTISGMPVKEFAGSIVATLGKDTVKREFVFRAWEEADPEQP